MKYIDSESKNYLIYQCKESDENRGKHKAVQTCGRWSVRMTKGETWFWDGLQTKCPHCGVRGRKNAKTFEQYPSKDEAQDECHRRNGWVQLESNTTELIQ